MSLLDIINSPWALSAERLDEIQSIYIAHLRGEKADLTAIEARLGRPLANEPKGYDVVDGVAVLPVDGVLAKRANLFSAISGGTSTQLAIRDLRQALQDPNVRAIILAVDSPGGTVDGTQTFGQEIAAANKIKPVYSWASGTMASAAYWAPSAAGAGRLFIADETTLVGSIGVVAQHVDTSGADRAAGIVKREIYAGKYKRIASSNGPLTESGQASMQAQVDYTYSLFVADVARNRGVAVDKVLENMADGRVFMGQQAIDAGLVDGIVTLDALIARLSGGAGASPRFRGAGAALDQSSTTSSGVSMQTAAEVQAALAAHPEIANALRAEGATAERTRILGIQALTEPGHEALIASFVADAGKQPGDAAIAIVQANKQALAGKAAALAQDATKPVAAAAAPGADADKPAKRTRAELDAAAKKLAAEKGISYVAAVTELESQPGA